MNDLIKIDETGKTTARELYEFLELRAGDFSRWCRTNIIENQFAEEGIDWMRLRIDAETPTGGKVERDDYNLTIPFSKKLCMLSKTERGEQARNYFIEIENRYRKQPLPVLSQAQILAAIAQQAADQEQKLIAMETRTEKVERTLTIVKDTIVQRDNWRQQMNDMVSKIAENQLIVDHHATRVDTYKLLESRAGCDLSARQRNMRQRLEEGGATKTKVAAVTKMDVIESDKRLKEIYSAVVKEMFIKYVA
jgi:anti-repressor protein